MKVLLTGATGFVAHHFISELAKGGHELFLSSPTAETLLIDNKRYTTIACELSHSDSVENLILETMPDAVVHLAAISNVPKAEKDRALLSQVNVVGTHNLCAAASKLPAITFLFVSTALVYGGDEHLLRCDENTSTSPTNAYGMSKLAAEYVVQGFRSDTFKAYIVRPFNHIGPGQSPDFVCTALAKRVYDAKDGTSIVVGNLEAQRDFSDVRDIVKAYHKILVLKPERSLFVLGRGTTVSIRSILDQFIKFSGKSLEVKVDPTLLRASDDQIKFADTMLARQALQWQPETSLEQSLRDIYQSLSH